MFGRNKKYTRKKIITKYEKNRVYGEAWIPTGDGPFPLIIYCHGCGMDDAMFPHEVFAEQGVAVFAFDFCGGCPWSNSTGDTKEMSAATEAADLESVLDQMKQQSFVDPNRIYLMGFDLGGMVATMVAGKRKNEIAGLFLFAPSYVIPEFQQVMLGGMAVPDTIRYSNMVVGRQFVTDVAGYDIYADMKAYEGPVLLYVGEDDEKTPKRYYDKAAETFSHVTYHVTPMGGHVMHAGQEKEMVAEMVGVIRG